MSLPADPSNTSSGITPSSLSGGEPRRSGMGYEGPTRRSYAGGWPPEQCGAGAGTHTVGSDAPLPSQSRPRPRSCQVRKSPQPSRGRPGARLSDTAAPGQKPFERELSRAAWAQQKQRESIHTLDRQAVMDHVRDHTFRYDRSPRRELERQQSFARSLARSYTPLEPHRVVTRIPTRQLGRQLERLVGTRDAGRDESVGGATFRPRLREEDQEHERGMGW